MSRVLLIPSLLLFLLAVVAYFFSATSPVDPSRSTQKPIVFCNADHIATLDISRMSWAGDLRVAMGLWEGLASYDPTNLEPVPGVAEVIPTRENGGISADGKTYTFHLRADAEWSNGNPVTSADFVFAWKRVLTPATGSDYIGFLQNLVVGGQEYSDAIDKHMAAKEKGETPPPWPVDIAGVKTPDPRTLIVQLKVPCTYFMDLCAFPTLYPLNEAAMKPFLNEDPTKGYDGTWTHPPNLVTNGPYALAEWSFQRHLLLKPNEHYWDRANVKCEALYIKAIPNDERAALLALETGTIDAMSFVPKSFGEELLADQASGKRKDVHFRPVFGSYYYLFNCTKPPLDDWRVRMALAITVDREQIVSKILRMGHRPIGLFVPPDAVPGPPKYESPPELQRDIEKAKKLLAEAGYPGKGLRTLEVLVNSDDAGHLKVSQAMGQMWKQQLGVEVSYRALERGSFSTARKERISGKPTFDIARAGWYGDYMDPTTWLDLLRAKDNNNDGLFDYPPFEEILNKAAAETDPAKRFGLLRDAERVALEQAPLIPLYQYSDGYMFDGAKIDGLEVNVRLLTLFKWIRRVE